MIERANDPNASRAGWPVGGQSAAKPGVPTTQRVRPGHAWPFLSRHVERPNGADASKNPRSDSGS